MKKDRKITLKVFCIITVFIFTFTGFGISALEDERLHQNADREDAQVNDANDTPVVTTDEGDQLINSNQPIHKDDSLTPISNATSLASGYIQAGKNKDEIITTLTKDMGYTQTEAEIAYSKATNQMAEEPEVQEANASRQLQTEATEDEPELTELKPAKDRVAEGIEQKPTAKIRIQTKDENGNIVINWKDLFNPKKVTDKEKNTVTEMLDEGYSIEDIAQGFADNGYSTAEIAAIFKEAGVSAEDAYSALSKIEIKKAEQEVEQNQPTAKFNKIYAKIKGPNWQESQLEEKKNQAKQEAVLTVLDVMKEAGYDIQGALDGAVQDLKDAGMSAAEVYDTLIGKVADGKPQGKFASRFGSALGPIFSMKMYGKANMTSYGEGEVALAAAMMKAGYSNEEIEAQFENKSNNRYGYYSYNTNMIKQIMTEAGNRLEHTNQQNNTTSPNNTTTQQDILRRQTQATPI